MHPLNNGLSPLHYHNTLRVDSKLPILQYLKHVYNEINTVILLV